MVSFPLKQDKCNNGRFETDLKILSKLLRAFDKRTDKAVGAHGFMGDRSGNPL